MFASVSCPHCGEDKIAEVLNGVSRVKCRKCRRLVTYGREAGGTVRIHAVDKDLSSLQTRVNRIAHAS